MEQQRLELSATAIQQHMSSGMMVRIVWDEQIYRVLCAEILPNDAVELLLRARGGALESVVMSHVQRVFAEVGEYAIR